MNKWLLLLIVAALAVAGWFRRDQVMAFLASKGALQAVGLPTPAPPFATPNPAPDSIALAKQAYPALGKEGSPFNRRFVALYNSLKESDPQFLAQPDWPVRLAERTAMELGGGAMPVPGMATPPVVVHLEGTALDKPAGRRPVSGTPSPDGGSSLDQKPTPPIRLH